MKCQNKNSQKGFTILVAVVTAGILLIIAMSIGGIALKEQVLSTANKESQIAFYAADTGLECAAYWDQRHGRFGPGTNSAGGVVNPDPGSRVSFRCAGNAIASGDNITTEAVNIISAASPNKYSYTFKVDGIPVGKIVAGGPTTCAIVTITKSTNDTNYSDPSKTHTTIESRGYNTCGPSLNRLERGIVSSN